MNKVMLIGNLAADPELKQTASGKYTTEIRLGVNRRGRDAGCDWLSVVCWQTTAEAVCKYLHKGDKIAVSGRLQSRSYEAKDGGKRYVTEVVADKRSSCPADQAVAVTNLAVTILHQLTTMICHFDGGACNEGREAVGRDHGLRWSAHRR